MLDKSGVQFIGSTGKAAGINICSLCCSLLTKRKIPQMALANDLYHGSLPEQFADLTLVEEKVCALYCITAHVTRLFQSSDPTQPRVFHGNTCTHEMNTVSMASVLPCTPTDVNGFLSVVFIGPEKFNPNRMGSLFRVRRQKIWSFLVWLHHHNALYANIPLDYSIMSLYPEDGPIPGLVECVVENHELSVDVVFGEETAGFSEHPVMMLADGAADLLGEQTIMVEKIGMLDPESNKLTGRSFVASAIRNLLPKDAADIQPDLVIHHNGRPVPEYNNPCFFPGLYPTLFPYGLGGFEIKSRPTALSFKQQAKYFLSVSNRAFHYHNSFIFVLQNILQHRQAHLQTHFTVGKSNFKSVARQLTTVSPVLLQCLALKLELEHKLVNPTNEERNALRLLQQVNTMSACIPGSQASKIFVRNEIHNDYGYFGLPHIFFTFNPSPAHSPVFQVMFGDTTVDLSKRFPMMPCGRERALRLAQDPVATTDFFEFSFRCLFHHLFRWDFDTRCSTASGGILSFV